MSKDISVENQSENPFQSPETSDSNEPTIKIANKRGTRADLIDIAKYQRGVLFCILLYFILLASSFFIKPELMKLLYLLYPIVGLTAAVFVFLLAFKIYTKATAILLAVMTLIPFFGLIFLAVINSKATNILKQNKIRVGLLGANSKDI